MGVAYQSPLFLDFFQPLSTRQDLHSSSILARIKGLFPAVVNYGTGSRPCEYHGIYCQNGMPSPYLDPEMEGMGMYHAGVEVLKDQIVGLVPVYNQRGDETELITAAGLIHYDRRSFHAVKKALGRVYAIDLQAQARMLQAQLGRKNLLPLYLERSRVFIPIKVRQARVKNDSAYGYVNWKYIKDVAVKRGQPSGTLSLSNGIDLSVCSSQPTIIQNLHMGRQVSQWLVNQGIQEEGQERMLIEAMRVLAGTLDVVKNAQILPGMPGNPLAPQKTR